MSELTDARENELAAALEAFALDREDYLSQLVTSGLAGRAEIVARSVEDLRLAASTLRANAARFDMIAHLRRHKEFSERTFGPGQRTKGVVDHIRKELLEIEADPNDLEEWIDVMMLAIDGAWRTGATPDQIIAALEAKQAKNEARAWPDWRTADPDKAIEHVRDDAARAARSNPYV